MPDDRSEVSSHRLTTSRDEQLQHFTEERRHAARPRPGFMPREDRDVTPPGGTGPADDATDRAAGREDDPAPIDSALIDRAPTAPRPRPDAVERGT
ncbi:hypothetical protein JSY14_09710 [Brachybacterium sp. EF45031]|uniref:hypothetical protein n=1 Tax=Brachybacterium sillae TaxID=2810536 RepID=UPI00217CE033|nr:hypothetical protein [Brachybacterium sillae]MCS6712279.1 hypothetical protein [Brachybacterium sillae]